MKIAFLAPDPRHDPDGACVIREFARHLAPHVEGVRVHRVASDAQLAMHETDVLLVPANLADAEPLFARTTATCRPLLLFQGYGVQDDPAVGVNLSLASHVLCTSPWLVEEAVRAGCLATLIRVGASRESCLADLPTNARRPVVGMMSSRLEWKGTIDGLEALTLARADVPELEIRLFGGSDPGFRGATFTPWPNDSLEIPPLLRDCAVFVCPSWHDGVDRHSIGAILSGAALATTDSKGSRDYAFHGRTALVSPPRNPSGLAGHIVELVRAPLLRERLVEAGRRHIEETYPDWPRAAAALLSAVRTAAADSDADAPQSVQPTGSMIQWRVAADASPARQEAQVEREALESELDETRRRLDLATRGEANARRELAELMAELELANAQRRRFAAALSRARADAQIAEAERAAFERRVVELSAQLPPVPPDQPQVLDPPTDLAITPLAGLPTAARLWPPLSWSEEEARHTFLETYRRIAVGGPDGGTGRDPLSLPIPADSRGALATGSEDQEEGSPSVDVVVCVHDALDDVRLCLWSLLHKATRRFHLILVNDGSDQPTTDFLASFAAEHDAVTLIHRSEAPHGYTLAANTGLQASMSDYVVLLNSDTVVSHRWLERIVRYGERHPRLGILGPLSNAASHQSIPERRAAGAWATNPLPDWLTVDGLALVLDRVAPRVATHLPFINGFCYVIRRAVVNAIGYFDEEQFPEGYAEENDYSQRARAAGFELGVVDDAYVYHAKSRSFGPDKRNVIASSAYKRFLAKHGENAIQQLVQAMEGDTSLDPVRTAVGDAVSSPDATQLALSKHDDLLRAVTFVVTAADGDGSGVPRSIYEVTQGLRQLGLEATIAADQSAFALARVAYGDANDVIETFSTPDELSGAAAGAQVIIAGQFAAVDAVASLCARRNDCVGAYYMHDYDPISLSRAIGDRRGSADRVLSQLLLLSSTQWLCNFVSRTHKVFVAKVEPGIDQRLYKPAAARADNDPLRVAALVQPLVAQSQPSATVAVLEQLVEALPGTIEVTTFGCSMAELENLTSSPRLLSSHLGALGRQQVAEVLAQSDLFLNMSVYEPRGTMTLEAMACGCVVVAPRLGCVWELIANGAGCVPVDTFDREAAFRVASELLNDRDELMRLRAAASKTAARYAPPRAALSHYVVLREALEARLG